MKKTIIGGDIPQAWDAGTLYGKAQRYADQMIEANTDPWIHALYSSFALELLARSALSNISPALLAEISSKNWHNLYHSLGFTPKEPKFSPKSIGIQEVLDRLGIILRNFDKELREFCIVHTGRRNAELHSGDTPFDALPTSAWRAPFYRSCEVFLESMGFTLTDFIGVDQARIAHQIINAANDETAKAVLGDIEIHKRLWKEKTESERKHLMTLSLLWATRQNGHRVNCPSCNASSLVFGEAVGFPQQTLKNDQITERQSYLPIRFECISCGLKISGLSRLNVLGIGDMYNKTIVYDASEYYSPSEDFNDYEPDNNEPF